MTAMEWIALASLLFAISSAMVSAVVACFLWLVRELRTQATINQDRHTANTNRLTRIETKLNIIGNGSIAHLPGPEE
jgi:hypothetical protein